MLPIATLSTVRRMDMAVPPAGEGGISAIAVTTLALSATVDGVGKLRHFSTITSFGIILILAGPGTVTFSILTISLGSGITAPTIRRGLHGLSGGVKRSQASASN